MLKSRGQLAMRWVKMYNIYIYFRGICLSVLSVHPLYLFIRYSVTASPGQAVGLMTLGFGTIVGHVNLLIFIAQGQRSMLRSREVFSKHMPGTENRSGDALSLLSYFTET